MSPIGMIRNKITSAGAKGAEQIRAAAVRATARNGKEPYAYEEPSEDVLLMQENISERLREGEIPSSVLGSSLYLKKDARPPLFSVFVDVKEPDLRLFRSTLTSVLEQTYGEYELYIIDRGISDQVRDVVAWYKKGSTIWIFRMDPVLRAYLTGRLPRRPGIISCTWNAAIS